MGVGRRRRASAYDVMFGGPQGLRLHLRGDAVHFAQCRHGAQHRQQFDGLLRPSRLALRRPLRRQQAEKRGGGLDITALYGVLDVAEPDIDDGRLLDLDRALGDLDAIDPEAVQLVELRYFAGLPLEQIAPLLGVSERTLKRRWRTARAFLHRQLGAAGHDA